MKPSKVGVSWQFALLLGMTAVLSPAAQAHHSFAMFDRTKTVTLAGTVKDWQWVNPHSWLQLVVTDSTGKVTEWSIEGRSPNVLERRGWTKSIMAVGDKVTVVAYPLKTGEPGGAFVRLTLPSGRELNADTPTAVDPDEEGPRR
jgi:Family of unknown function (DUF6152)